MVISATNLVDIINISSQGAKHMTHFLGQYIKQTRNRRNMAVFSAYTIIKSTENGLKNRRTIVLYKEIGVDTGVNVFTRSS